MVSANTTSNSCVYEELLSEADKLCGYLHRISNDPCWTDSKSDAQFVLRWLNEDELFLRVAELRRIIQSAEERREELRARSSQSDDEKSSSVGGSLEPFLR